ncbi:MAG: CPBP family intramembrane metalloprotease [Planctomycetota bacterium]|nr:MAG: CPBP family intramembrane metalloprotease [Planctomycetota bacterium]
MKVIAAGIPYVAVLIGLYILRSAWAAIGLYHFGIALLLIADDKGRSLKKIRSGYNSIITVASCGVCVLIVPTILVLWQYMQSGEASLKVKLTDLGLQGTSWYFFMVYFSTVQPFLEELYWRGYLGSKQRYLCWSDLAFGGYHMLVLVWFIKLPWLAVSFIVLSIAAWAWRYAAGKLGGLAVPLLSHIVADASIIGVAYIL